MDVSAFMTGYFIGLCVGAGAIAWWFTRYGGFSRKAWGKLRRELAGLIRRKGKPLFASSRRDHPAE